MIKQVNSIKPDSKITFNNNENKYCLFKDELNRNVICYVIRVGSKFIPKIFELDNNDLIQSYGESRTFSEIYYYKDVLSLVDIKDYLIISNYNNTCHILILNKETKLYQLNKVIQNDNRYISVIPNDNLTSNIIIIHNYFCVQSVYELDTNNTSKLYELDDISAKWYYPYYTYDRKNENENSYIIECSINRVRILVPKEKDNILKEFQIKDCHNYSYCRSAIVVEKDNKKQLYCSSSCRKIFIFDYDSLCMLKTIDNTSQYIIRLSNSEILGYDNEIKNELIIIKTDTNSIDKRIYFENKDCYFFNSCLQILNSSKQYISVLTSKETLIYELN